MTKIFEIPESAIDHTEIHDFKICVIGIGRIGLPTALSFAKSGLLTIGVDINEDLVKMINDGIFPLKDEPGYPEIFDKCINQKKFFATTDLQMAVSKSDVIVLSLPTPMDQNNIPNYNALKIVANDLSKFITSGKLIIIESTIEPGFIENELKQIFEKNNNLVAGVDFGLGVCPETANPGQILSDFEKLPRLIGAIDKKSHKLIKKLYASIFSVELISMPNCKTANAVKLTTNVFRDLNIGYINELAIIFEKAGIDIMTVLEAAKTKYNFQVHYPGPGVGGPCLPVNSYQMINFAKNLGFENFSTVDISRKINETMPDHTISLLEDALMECEKKLENSSILILGVSYKPDVKDVQLTPAENIISKLRSRGCNVSIFDPYYKDQILFGVSCKSNFVDSLKNSDAIVIVTAHKEFLDIDPTLLKSNLKTPIVIDSKCIIDQEKAKKVNLIYRGIGRGRI